MFSNAKNGTVKIGTTDMCYVSFGGGEESLIILPGLSDGLMTVKGKAILLAGTYREFAAKYRVYLFSRKNRFEKGYSTRDMARDQAEVMMALGISQANVMGVSQGGMVSQYLAIDYPHLVSKLILAVTLSKQNETIQKVVSSWIEMAKRGDYKGIMIDTAEKTYSERYLRAHRFLFKLMSGVGKPADFSRFIIQGHACMNHNAYEELDKIECPTLVIGGDSDDVAGPHSSAEIAGKIKNCRSYIYKGLGHAAYEEGKDFNERVLDFLRE